MKKSLLVLTLLISVVFSSEVIGFKKLTELASNDLGKNIFLDKDIKDYEVIINLPDHQKKGQMYEFYKIVLFNYDMKLQYNTRGDFYFIKESKKDFEPEAPIEIHKDLKPHYYTYKIKNTTNDDVVKCMSIFPDVRYQYLVQSDMIAYSSTLSEHRDIVKILNRADKKLPFKTIKITMFAINKKNLLRYGSSINSFNYNFDSTLDGIFEAFRNGGQSQFRLDDTMNIGFTLHALQGRSVADIFQQPTIRLTNGVKTSIKSVVNVPYLKTTSMVDSTTNSITEQYEYKDIGLQIEIDPRIKNDWVYLDLSLISDELLSLDEDKPITQKIAYQNSIKVSKGKPILLTGIKKTNKQISKGGVPVLSNIPILGELFKEQETSNDEQNINILIEVI